MTMIIIRKKLFIGNKLYLRNQHIVSPGVLQEIYRRYNLDNYPVKDIKKSYEMNTAKEGGGRPGGFHSIGLFSRVLSFERWAKF